MTQSRSTGTHTGHLLSAATMVQMKALMAMTRNTLIILGGYQRSRAASPVRL